MKKLTIIFVLLFTTSVYPCAPTYILGRTVQPVFSIRATLILPVPNAVVKVTNLNTGAKWYVRTNPFGYFGGTLPCGNYEAVATAKNVQFQAADFLLKGEPEFAFFISTGVVSMRGAPTR